MSHWNEEKAKEITRDCAIAGDDLKGWREYAKGNSYHPDRAQLRHDIGTEGAKQDFGSGIPDMPRQKRSEGKGWADMDKVTADNTFTGKDGTTEK
jgi:hypothetical protein